MTGKDLLEALSALSESELLLPVRIGDEDGSRNIGFVSVVCGGEGGSDFIPLEDADEAECNPDPTAIFVSLED